MISLHIPAANAFIFAISLVVGCVVYRRNRDLTVAIAATAACVVAMAFLFGLGDGSAPPVSVPTPADTTPDVPPAP